MLPLAALVVMLAPAGFHAAPILTPAASYVAHKPVVVYCANTQYDWEQYLAAHRGDVQEASALTVPGSHEIYAVPHLCKYLGQQIRKPGTVPVPTLGSALEILTHESIHARGEANEGITDCAAVHEVAGVASRFFKVKPGKQLRTLMAAVWKWRRAGDPQFLTVC